MNFNGLEMTAVIKAAKAMIAADGRVDDSEMKLLSAELLNFGVSGADLDEKLTLSDAMEPAVMISVLSRMNNSQKKYVSGFLASLMIVDKNISESEIKLWQLTSTLMGCPTMTLQEALQYWREN